MSALVEVVKGEPRVDSRLLAEQLGNAHESVMRLLTDYQADFEQLGILRFQIGEITGRGQPAKFTLLNEDQAYLLLTYSRNTAKVRALKVRLVQAFRDARSGQTVTSIEYLPGYHELHSLAHELAAGSPNERFVHMNLNKLVNKTVGIGSGERQTVATPTKSAIVVAQTLATKAMSGAKDHHDGYQAAKQALGKFHTLLIGGAS